MIASSGIGDFFGGVWDGIKSDVTTAKDHLVTDVRTDLANAANQVGAAATNAAVSKIAPPGQKPTLIPLSANQLTIAVVVLVVLLASFFLLVFRRR